MKIPLTFFMREVEVAVIMTVTYSLSATNKTS
jgi:hypothetical protein